MMLGIEAVEPTHAEGQVDWQDCALVETIAGKVSGAPLLKGTRMPAQTIIDNIDAGMTPSEVAETWQLDLATVIAIHAFAETYRARAAR
nr:DUF433 domain-containing protein [uncultured Rhodopila sp.]